jgi:hypothetical protein
MPDRMRRIADRSAVWLRRYFRPALAAVAHLAATVLFPVFAVALLPVALAPAPCACFVLGGVGASLLGIDGGDARLLGAALRRSPAFRKTCVTNAPPPPRTPPAYGGIDRPDVRGRRGVRPAPDNRRCPNPASDGRADNWACATDSPLVHQCLHRRSSSSLAVGSYTLQGYLSARLAENPLQFATRYLADCSLQTVGGSQRARPVAQPAARVAGVVRRNAPDCPASTPARPTPAKRLDGLTCFKPSPPAPLPQSGRGV